MHRPTQTMERALRKKGLTIIAGCDEAGRGAWAGPLVAAAVVLPENVRLPGVRDSKLLSERQRERQYDCILNKALAWNVAVITVERIDQHGVHRANLVALCQAVAKLSVTAEHALIDTFHVETAPAKLLPFKIRPGTRTNVSGTGAVRIRGGLSPRSGIPPSLKKKKRWREEGLMSCPSTPVLHGDRHVLSIAAASVLAKVTRDRMMRELDRTFPHYGFAQHKGYGTPQHQQALKRYGPTPFHRTSFAPIARLAVLGVM